MGDVGLVVVTLAVALGVGRLAGGRLARLGALPLRRRRLLLFAVLAEVAGLVVGGPLFAAGLLVAAGLVGAFLLANRGVRGTGLVALGLLANALVIAANGAMPVSLDATARAGADLQPVLAGNDPRHRLLTPRTRLPWLADVVPVPLPVVPQVASPGDVLVAAGAAQLVVTGMLRPRRGIRPVPPVPEGWRPRRRFPVGHRGPVRRRRSSG